MVTLLQDIRYAFRMLLKNPGFTIIAALSLALGIGANGAIFSLADAVLLRPLPVLEPSSVVTVSTNTPDNPFGGVSYPNYRDLREKAQAVDGMVAYQLSVLSMASTSKDAPQIRMGMLVSDNFFDMLGIRPGLGRGFLPEEGKVPGRDAVVVLSYDYWLNQMRADRSVVGKTMRIKGIDFNIVGIAPKGFTGVDQYFQPVAYIPVMMAQRLSAAEKDPVEDRNNHAFSVKARLKDGISISAARAELTTIWSGLLKEYEEANRTRNLAVQTELQARVQKSPPDSALISMLMALVGVVLLIACANVANLLLGRGRARTREIALRISLGASRLRLLRQLLTESLLLALVGGTVGLFFAYGGVRFLQTIEIPIEPPIVLTTRLDGRVLLFSLVAAVLSSLVFGLAPALQSLKTELVPSLKANSAGLTVRGRTIGRNALVVAQVALSMVLLVVSGMLLDGFRKTLVSNPGFSADHRMMMEFDTTLVRYTPEQSREFYKKLAEQGRMVSGVRCLTLARSIPFTPNQYGASVVPEGYELPKGQDSETLFANIVDENYFTTMKSEIVKGRGFAPDDKEGSRRVAVVNEEFAKAYWPNQEPLGKRFRLNDPQGPWVEVVGLAKTAKYLFISENPTKFFYLPFAQNPINPMILIAETDGDPAAIATPLREVARSLDANQPVYNVRTLSSFYKARAVAIPLMITEMVSTMGLLGLLLALVGLYGLISYSVSRRIQEIGIRMAIGAASGDVLKMVLREGLLLSVIGIGLGGAAAFAVARLLASALFGLATMNVATFVLVPLMLVAVTLAACYVPARRASLIDPLVALRYE